MATARINQAFRVIERCCPETKKVELFNQAMSHFQFGQRNIDGRAKKSARGFFEILVGAAQCALAQAVDAGLKLSFKRRRQRAVRRPGFQCCQQRFTCRGMFLHFETLGITHQFVGGC